jgi:radical SAM superfamily enzyme YgiQ (UPF0313 family)
MRILLVTPENRFVKAFRRGQVNNFVQLTMPYLAGFVRPGDDVILVDEYNEQVDLDAAVELVGITCNTPNARHVYEMADAFRLKGRKVVLGGPHPTILPDEAKAHADSIVIGEAERTWPKLLRDCAAGELRPFYSDTEPVSLVSLPVARRDLIRGRRLYRDTVIATRGCPHRCNFCNLRQIYHPSLRFRPVADVIKEIRTLRSPVFAFWDDQLMMDRAYALELFHNLAPLGKRWAAMVTTLASRDEQLLKAAARAGCVCLFIGLESFSNDSLRLAHKSFNLVEAYAEDVARIHRYGIAVQAGIVFGFDGDDDNTFETTLRETDRIGLDGATVSILTPFPGTSLFDDLMNEGRLLTSDWSYYNGKTAVTFHPRRMSAQALWDGYSWFRRQFFSPARVMKRALRTGCRPVQTLILNAGYWKAMSNQCPGTPLPRKMEGASKAARNGK